jgi:hypothetical protein
LNIVAYPLDEAEKKLQTEHIDYKIIVARHKRYLGEGSDSLFYVIRQQIDTKGMYYLVVAAKLGKGVL